LIYESGICCLGDLRCRVQVRQCLDGTVLQRHVWLVDAGGPVDPPRYDPWIPSYTRNFAASIRNKVEAPHERDEQEELVAALREIAAGHNDPRARAIEALRRAGLPLTAGASASTD